MDFKHFLNAVPWSKSCTTCYHHYDIQHYERVASAIRARYSRLKLIANCDLGPGFDYAAWEFHTYRDAGSTFRLRTLFDEYQVGGLGVLGVYEESQVD
eukprot:1138603-Pelagomonas_calceolata.AAC.7